MRGIHDNVNDHNEIVYFICINDTCSLNDISVSLHVYVVHTTTNM